MKCNKIGIMQGRLSDKTGMPLQSFPWDDWKNEFERASDIGFDQIEWLIDGNDDNNNPIASKNGQKEIINLSKKYGVSVNSLCAHSLINGDLLNSSISNVENAKNKLLKILSWASAIDIDFVILPIMDSMSIINYDAKNKLKRILQEVLNKDHPMILLESDLPATQLNYFLESVGIDNLGVLYDLGNATALNFNIGYELKVLYKHIKEVHIKDRYENNGVSTRLGNADVLFDTAFKVLKELSWKGSFILETPVFDDWSSEAYNNFNFINSLINKDKASC